jgi:hypothetical protein
MSKQVFISMLRKGNNGTEILSILDAITSDNITSDNVNCDRPSLVTWTMPTFEEIDF